MRTEECWNLCPNDEGPEHTWLIAPDTRSQRYRVAFRSGERTIRACTPVVLRSRTPDGSLSVGSVMGEDQIWREIRLKEHLEAHGPDEAISLQRLADASDRIGQLRCYRVNDAWLLAYRGHIPYDAWFNRILSLLHSHERRDLFNTLDRLVDQIDPLLSSRLHWDRVLHVPVDMTKPIEGQLARIRSYLVEAREYLYQYTRKSPPRDKTRTTWRDVYIYLLAGVADWHPSKIAEKVFPKEGRRSRQLKAAQIIRMVDRAAKAVGFTVEPPVNKLDPPAKISTPS